jgi:hypothetical protein
MDVNIPGNTGNTVLTASPEQQLAQLRLDLMHEVQAVQHSVQTQNAAVLAEVHQLFTQHAVAPAVPAVAAPIGLQQGTAPSTAPAVSSAAKINPPECYTGARTQNIDDFCFQITRYVEYNRLQQNTPQAVQCASSYLHGQAAQWWRVYCERNQSPVSVHDFCELLQQHFRAPNFEVHAKDRLTNLVQLDGRDSLRRYTEAFLNTVTALQDMSSSDLTYYYIRGLQPRLKGELRARNPTNLEHAMQLADNYDQSFRDSFQPSGRRYNWTPKQWQPQPPPDPNGPAPMQLGSLQLPVRNHPSSQTGPPQQPQQRPQRQQQHSGTDGKYVPKCQLCRKPGHYANQCPLLPSNVQLPTFPKSEPKNGQRRH